ncbi:MAG: hypothetical protein JWO89_3856, partial [Verrucomicrobiaceae bacterium]|nr:hypothetical protein [Verrucomicrobiaceae bacterium]
LIAPAVGVWIVSRLGFACVFAVHGPIKTRDALYRSWIISEGHGWRSFGMCLLMFTLFVTLWGMARHRLMGEMVIGNLSFLTLYPIRILEGVPSIVFYAFMVCFHLELEEAERLRHPELPELPELPEASVAPLVS